MRSGACLSRLLSGGVFPSRAVVCRTGRRRRGTSVAGAPNGSLFLRMISLMRPPRPRFGACILMLRMEAAASKSSYVRVIRRVRKLMSLIPFLVATNAVQSGSDIVRFGKGEHGALNIRFFLALMLPPLDPRRVMLLCEYVE